VVFGAVGQINLNANRINLNADREIHLLTTHPFGVRLRSPSNPGLTLTFGSMDVTASLLCSQAHIDNQAIVYGSLDVWGFKRFIHPHPTDTAKVIRYVAIESGEALTLARGTAKTVNGQATIALPEHFSLVTSKTEPITTILTPKGAPVLLYVKQENREQIVVSMKQSDFTEFRDVEFAFQVTGVRDGFEKQEVIIDVEKLDSQTLEKDSVKYEMRQRIKAHAERARAKHEMRYKTEE